MEKSFFPYTRETCHQCEGRHGLSKEQLIEYARQYGVSYSASDTKPVLCLKIVDKIEKLNSSSHSRRSRQAAELSSGMSRMSLHSEAASSADSRIRAHTLDMLPTVPKTPLKYDAETARVLVSMWEPPAGPVDKAALDNYYYQTTLSSLPSVPTRPVPKAVRHTYADWLPYVDNLLMDLNTIARIHNKDLVSHITFLRAKKHKSAEDVKAIIDWSKYYSTHFPGLARTYEKYLYKY